MLTPTQKKKARWQISRFCLVAEKYRDLWHYSQARPFTGFGVPASYTHHNDCSGYVSLVFYSAQHEAQVGIADPLGAHYSGTGNTDTCYAFLKAHHAPPDKYRVGDIALYLERVYEHHHVVVCRTGGTAETAVWSSMGGEADPTGVKLHYRHDLTGVYRHPALL